MELFNTKPFIQSEANPQIRRRKLHMRLLLDLVSLTAFLVISGFLFWLLVFSPYVGWITLITSLAFALIAYPWAIRVWRRARRYWVLDAATQMEKDSRAPILYLRSFLDQYTTNDARDDQRTDEELLTFVLKEVGPVIAIGIPGEELPPLGASRLYVADNDWENVVRKLMSDAQLVVISPGISEGLKTEMSFVRELHCEQKMIVPLKSLNLKTYKQFRHVFEEVFEIPLPEPLPKPVFLYISEENKVAFVRAFNWTHKLYSKRLLALFLGDGHSVVEHEALRLFLKDRNIVLKRSRVFTHMLVDCLANLVALVLLLTFVIGFFIRMYLTPHLPNY